MKKIYLLLLVPLVSFGCSGHDWLARIYIVKAENAYAKAYALRLQKTSYEERLKYYRKACDYFLKAYEQNSGAFYLSRIEAAA